MNGPFSPLIAKAAGRLSVALPVCIAAGRSLGAGDDNTSSRTSMCNFPRNLTGLTLGIDDMLILDMNLPTTNLCNIISGLSSQS